MKVLLEVLNALPALKHEFVSQCGAPEALNTVIITQGHLSEQLQSIAHHYTRCRKLSLSLFLSLTLSYCLL